MRVVDGGIKTQQCTVAELTSPSREDVAIREIGPVARVFGLVLVVVVVSAVGAILWRNDVSTFDVDIYRGYGEAVAAGKVPFRDFRLEYPPLALPAFVVPALLTSGRDGYRAVFALLMVGCEIGVLLLGLRLLGRLGGATAVQRAYGLYTPLLAAIPLGVLSLTRFDFWPALLVVAALAAAVSGRTRLAGVSLGLGVAAKLFPVVLGPLLIVFASRRKGKREGAITAAIVLAVSVLPFLPFLVVAPRGVWASVSAQLSRPLQIESLGASLLIGLHHVAGVDLGWEFSHGSYNLTGAGATSAAIVLTIIQCAALLTIWLVFARGNASPERLVVFSAAAVCAFVAFGKVLSPQFLLWLLPLVLLVKGRRGIAASTLLAAAVGLTVVWLPFRYLDLVRTFDPLASWALLTRNVLLVVLVAVLITPDRRRLGPASVIAKGSLAPIPPTA